MRFPEPTPLAVAQSQAYRLALQDSGDPLQISRVDASAMGGVGITHRCGVRKVYIEFYNDGRIHALFSDRHGGILNMETEAVCVFSDLIIRATRYLACAPTQDGAETVIPHLA